MEIKVCDECKINNANIHLTQVVQSEVTVLHLCEECASKKGISVEIEETETSSLTKDSTPMKNEKNTNLIYDKELTCSNCHLTFRDFKEKGWLGCTSCYKTFEKEIDSLLIQVHGSTQYKGKPYHRSKLPEGIPEDIESLRNELKKAIQSEKFELAARIRDKINEFPSSKSSNKITD